VGKLSGHDRHGETGTCVRCLEVKDLALLDRLFWCDVCRRRALLRATRLGRAVGFAVTLLLALWIALVVQPARDLILGGWAAAVIAAFYLSVRITREVGYGVMRLLNRRAVEAVPPALPEEREPREGEER
jgi:hypothetical protein